MQTDQQNTGEPQCLEHDAIGWLSAVRMLSMPLAPADRLFVTHELAGN